MTYPDHAPAQAGAGLVLADAPAPPDAAVDAVKSYLRLDGDDEAATVVRLAAAALQGAERFLGHIPIVRPMRQWLTGLTPMWQALSCGPVTAIGAVETLDSAGTATALPIGAYAIDIDAQGDGWVRILDGGGATRLRASFEAGLVAAWEDLASPIQQGVVRLAAHLFAHRDAAPEVGLPASVTALWTPYRRFRL